MRSRSHGPSRCRRWLALAGALAAALACAQPASARALLVATGTPELWLVELSTNAVVAQLPMPGPVRSVAARPFGGRGYAAAGNSIVEIDIDGRTETRRATLAGAPISQLVTARDGRLMALQGDRVTLVSAASLASAGTIALGRSGRQLAAGRRAGQAAVVLTGGRVGILGLDERRLLRVVRVPGARGVAIDGGGRAWVTAKRSLRLIPAGSRKVSKTVRLELPRGAGAEALHAAGRRVDDRAAGGARQRADRQAPVARRQRDRAAGAARQLEPHGL
ncbi:MAG TPA: hypothetical protein VNT54_17790 [Solirubrobacteraceae bacterium]|nr:hypothetical protein [Solirubrobacteraceae bacterium]